jgi:6-phosphogluconolactonase
MTLSRVEAGEPEIVILPDPDAVALEGARRVGATIRRVAAERDRVDWATTGGSAPAGIYRHLSLPPLREEIPWSAVHLWWGDDRYVPADHPLSNVLPAEQILLNAVALAGLSGTGGDAIDVQSGQAAGAPLPVAQVHPFRMADALGEGQGPAWAAAVYDTELRESGIEVRDGWPVFDLVMLGVGPDGHVLSVFPGSAALDSRDWVLAIPAPSHVEPHVSRATLNPAVLDVARNVLVIVTGEAKASILATVFGEERDPRQWPAQLVRRSGVTWLLDEAAGAQLPHRG